MVVLLLSLIGCSGDDDVEPKPQVEPTSATADTGSPVDECVDTPATWENVAEPFLLTWCTPCHSSEIEGIARQGAPAGLDFNTWELAAPYAQLILAAATPDNPRMPPEGSANAIDRAWLKTWIECGALGPPTVPRSCDTVTLAPAGSSTPCDDGYNGVTGSLTPTDGQDLSCLCEVEGDLDLTAATSVHLPLLSAVGGSVHADSAGIASMSAPALTSIGGELRLVDLPDLAVLDLSNLKTVANGVLLSRIGPIPYVELPQLTDVGGDLVVEKLPLTTHLWLERVETVGGTYRVSDNPMLVDVPFWFELESVGGDLVLTNNPLVTDLLFATYLTSLGGSVEVGGNGLISLGILHDVIEVPGDVYVHDEPNLLTIAGLEDAITVGGSLRLHDLGMLDSAQLLPTPTNLGGIDLQRLGALRVGPVGTVDHIKGLVRFDDCGSLTGLPWLGATRRVEGDVELRDLPALKNTAVLANLQVIVGALELTRIGTLDANLDELEQVASVFVTDLADTDRVRFGALETVYGDVTLSGLPLATTIAMKADSVEILGTFTLSNAATVTDLTGLHTMGRLTGDLIITDNLLLPPSEVDDLAAAIEVHLGAVVNTGNGG